MNEPLPNGADAPSPDDSATFIAQIDEFLAQEPDGTQRRGYSVEIPTGLGDDGDPVEVTIRLARPNAPASEGPVAFHRADVRLWRVLMAAANFTTWYQGLGPETLAAVEAAMEALPAEAQAARVEAVAELNRTAREAGLSLPRLAGILGAEREMTDAQVEYRARLALHRRALSFAEVVRIGLECGAFGPEEAGEMMGDAQLADDSLASGFDEHDLAELLDGKVVADDDRLDHDERAAEGGVAVFRVLSRPYAVEVVRYLGELGGEDGSLYDREETIPIAGRTTEEVAGLVEAAAGRALEVEA